MDVRSRSSAEEVRPGLEGVVVAETTMSRVDGEAGTLVIRGSRVEDLVAAAGFEDVCALLWDTEPAATRAALGAARVAAFRVLEREGRPLPAEPMDALRLALGTLEVPEEPGAAPFLTGATGVAAAAWLAREEGRELAEPDPEAGHAADLIRLLTGSGDAGRARALDGYLVTVVDHGMNASTFTARVVASTASDTGSAVAAALGALKGPLHGGAPGPVLAMLAEIEAAGDAAGWIRAHLDAGHRIMGMGHRVYRVRDPRAAVLEELTAGLAAAGHPTRLDLAREVEVEAQRQLEARKPGRRLRANVEFQTAVLLDALGLPARVFPAVFASGRVAGWCAHVREQRAEGRLIRPRARYVGPEPGAGAPGGAMVR